MTTLKLMQIMAEANSFRPPDLVRQNLRIEEIRMIPDSAAERSQNVATAGGRGCQSRSNEPRSGERICLRSAAHAGAQQFHGLQPWLHSFSAPRLERDHSEFHEIRRSERREA